MHIKYVIWILRLRSSHLLSNQGGGGWLGQGGTLCGTPGHPTWDTDLTEQLDLHRGKSQTKYNFEEINAHFWANFRRLYLNSFLQCQLAWQYFYM